MRLLLIPHVNIDFNNKKINVMGPIYCKIINKIILEETNLNNLLYKKINNNVLYGIAFEKYLKLSLEYKTLGLFLEENKAYNLLLIFLLLILILIMDFSLLTSFYFYFYLI